MKDSNTYYVRYDRGRRSVVFVGTFEHLKRNIFQPILQAAKDNRRQKKPFRWPRDINELVRTLNYCTLVLGNTADFYTLTTREMAEQKHWPIVENVQC